LKLRIRDDYIPTVPRVDAVGAWGDKMKQLTLLILISMLLFSASTSNARNTIQHFSIEQALARGEAEGKIKSSVQLFFGDQAHPQVEQELATVSANRKTNAFGKSDESACQWAFLSAMITLQDRAIASGGDAVINIRSYYYQNAFTSATEFECGAGAAIAGVTMVGEVVKLVD